MIFLRRLVFITSCIFIMSELAFTQNSDYWGWEKPKMENNGVYTKYEKDPSSANLYTRMILYYKKEISPKQNKNCPCFPSCSTYTLYSMRKYGFLTGFIMGMDRIFFRENAKMVKGNKYKKIYYNETIKIYDIPESNYLFGKKDFRYFNPDFHYYLWESK